jgi:cytochrome c oxidase cbb3-type subunit 3
MRTLLVILVGAAICLAQTTPTPEDLKRGERLFQGHCAGCHGPRGSGGRGANLARPKLPRAPDDEALFHVIQDGIEGTEMPGAWQMTNREVRQTAAFVRTLGQRPEETVTGNAARGERVYLARGNCATCHMIKGKGGRLGPELSAIGLGRSASFLRAALLDPAVNLREISFQDRDPSSPTRSFQVVLLVTRDGRRIEGIHMNEDTFSIQIRDVTDRVLSFWKKELREWKIENGKSLMPAFRDAFTPAELDDLVAYLVSLRGEP